MHESMLYLFKKGGYFMPISEARRAANDRYNKKLRGVSFRVPPATADAIRAAADRSGQSLTQYILAALAAFGTFDGSALGDASSGEDPAGAGAGPGDPEN